MDSKITNWLWVSIVFGAESKHIREIIYRYEDISEAYEKLALSDINEAEKEMSAIGISETTSGKQLRRKVRTTPLSQCELVLNYCSEKNISVISYDDEQYPESLRNIDIPPAVLFCSGDVSLLNKKPAISVVGTRKASDYSLKVTKIICKDLSEDGFVIVSGFANGVDSASHMAAVESGGKTIAVIGCGNDVEYPSKSNKRKNEILSSGGLIVSEYLPGTTPSPPNFPKRNRILAALGLGTLIIQAPAKSGSLITAELALAMGKDIFCIPPTDIFDKSYEGVVKYLREGAIPVFSHLDIVNAYYFSYAHSIRADRIFSFCQPSEKKISVAKKLKKTKIPASVKNDESSEDNSTVNVAADDNMQEDFKIDFSKFDDESQRRILKQLSESEVPVHADEIAEKTGLDPMVIMAALTELEIYGTVKSFSGNLYMLKREK